MNSKDYRNLQEAYLDVYEQEITLKGTGPRLVDPYADSGESKSGGKMKGPKMKNVIKKEEFESWVNSLLEEGYDLSDYTWDELYENYTQLDEAITSEKGKAKAAEMIAKRTTASGRAKSGQGASVAAIKHIGRSNREGLSGTPMTPTMAKNPVKSASYGGTGNKAARRAGTYSRFGYKESYDLYDIILSHLIDEGYADTEEAAERIMVNMSEDWRESIVEQGLDPDAPGNTHSLADLHNALKKYEDKKNAAKSPKPGGSRSAGKVKENNK